MKPLFLVSLLILLSCTVIETADPIHCYRTEIKVSSTNGKILSTETYMDFLYEQADIDKCMAEVNNSPSQERDTVNHIVTIHFTTWIYPDIK